MNDTPWQAQPAQAEADRAHDEARILRERIKDAQRIHRKQHRIGQLDVRGECAMCIALGMEERRCGWRGMASTDVGHSEGCIRRRGHSGEHGFADGSGEQDEL